MSDLHHCPHGCVPPCPYSIVRLPEIRELEAEAKQLGELLRGAQAEILVLTEEIENATDFGFTDERVGKERSKVIGDCFGLILEELEHLEGKMQRDER